MTKSIGILSDACGCKSRMTFVGIKDSKLVSFHFSYLELSKKEIR